MQQLNLNIMTLNPFNLPSTEYDLYASGNLHSINHKQYTLERGDTVIVFLSYGKVGSTAVCRSLEHLKNPADRPTPVYHIHTFNGELPAHSRLEELLPHKISAKALREVFDVHRDNLNWRFINGVRDPISMLISAYFENLFELRGAPTIDMIRNYSNSFFDWLQNHNDREYRDRVGINIYSEPFDHKLGYSIVRKKNISALTYRIDKLTSIFPEAMEQFLNIPNLALKKANQGIEKAIIKNGISYSESYRAMIESFSFSSDRLDIILNHHSVTHFFTRQEIADIKQRWIHRAR